MAHPLRRRARLNSLAISHSRKAAMRLPVATVKLPSTPSKKHLATRPRTKMRAQRLGNFEELPARLDKPTPFVPKQKFEALWWIPLMGVLVVITIATLQ